MYSYERARLAWPGVEIPPEVFFVYVRERGHDPDKLEEVRVQDLYLACGCARGGAQALEHLQTRYLRGIAGSLTGGRWSRDKVEDAIQKVGVKLLVREDGGRLKIENYTGRGSLYGWLKRIVIRELIRDVNPDDPGDESDLAAIYQVWDKATPEHELDKRRYGHELRAIVHDAFRCLVPEERALLRLRLVGKLSEEKLALIHGVDQSTISRRLQRHLKKFAAETRRLMKERLKLSSDELGSVIRTADTFIKNMSLSQIFRDDPDDSDDSDDSDGGEK